MSGHEACEQAFADLEGRIIRTLEESWNKPDIAAWLGHAYRSPETGRMVAMNPTPPAYRLPRLRRAESVTGEATDA